ncbi:hypothetical protein U1Q18_037855 [Sarracenia purpurea var. burkii]
MNKDMILVAQWFHARGDCEFQDWFFSVPFDQRHGVLGFFRIHSQILSVCLENGPLTLFWLLVLTDQGPIMARSWRSSESALGRSRLWWCVPSLMILEVVSCFGEALCGTVAQVSGELVWCFSAIFLRLVCKRLAGEHEVGARAVCEWACLFATLEEYETRLWFCRLVQRKLQFRHWLSGFWAGGQLDDQFPAFGLLLLRGQLDSCWDPHLAVLLAY